MGGGVMILRALFGIGAVLLLVPCDAQRSSDACAPAACATDASDTDLTRVIAKFRTSVLTDIGRVRNDIMQASKLRDDPQLRNRGAK